MGVDFSRLGVTRDSEEFRVNTARLGQLAAALNDTNEAHLAGRIAPPVFHHVPVMQSMVEVLRSATSEFALHGEHDFHFHAPIEPGQRLFTLSRLIGIRATSAGTALVIRSDLTMHDRKPISTQYSTCLVTTVKSEQSIGEQAPKKPEPKREGTPRSVKHELTPDQTRRYADAARDYSPYTLDKDAAKKLGFPAPIVHGLCTLGFASRAIVDEGLGGDVRKLLRLGGRMSSPVFMVKGQALTTRLWSSPPKEGKRLIAFETVDKDGNLAIKNGYAEVRS